MGRKARGKKEPRTSGATWAVRQGPNWPLLALSIIGCGLAGYLTWTGWNDTAVAGCTEGSGCDVVLSSRWATLMGVPTALWGLMAYLSLAGIAFISRADRHWRWAWTMAFFGVLYSAYLTTISLTVLGATCPYCLTSLALMTAIVALVTMQRPLTLPGFTWRRWLSVRGAVAVGLIVFLHLNYTGVVGQQPAAEDPALRALAEHVATSGALMYGAHWCSHCQDQKALFGVAAKRLPYIECSTGGQGSPQTAECRTRGIKIYPTWVINGRRYEELLTPTRLAELTGYKPAAAPNSGG